MNPEDLLMALLMGSMTNNVFANVSTEGPAMEGIAESLQLSPEILMQISAAQAARIAELEGTVSTLRDQLNFCDFQLRVTQNNLETCNRNLRGQPFGAPQG